MRQGEEQLPQQTVQSRVQRPEEREQQVAGNWETGQNTGKQCWV